MKCTNCGKNVKDGTSICPYCDAILDESFLGDLPPGGDAEDDTPPPEPEPARPARRAPTAVARPSAGAARKPLRKAPVPEPEPEPQAEEADEAAPADGEFRNKYSQYWTEDEPKPKKPAAAPQPSKPLAGPSAAAPGASDGEAASDPMIILRQFWADFQALHFEDKVTAASAAALFFFSLMPWRGYKDPATGFEDDLMGFTTWGFFTMLFGALAAAGIWARRSGKVPQVPDHLWSKLSTGLGGLSAVICVIYAISAWDREQVGRAVDTVAWPAFGVFLSLIAAAGVTLGGFLTLKRESKGA